MQVRLSAARAISSWSDVPMNERVLRALICNSGERFGVRDEDVEVALHLPIYHHYILPWESGCNSPPPMHAQNDQTRLLKIDAGDATQNIPRSVGMHSPSTLDPGEGRCS